jgi:uncharacterized transporter YbjL
LTATSISAGRNPWFATFEWIIGLLLGAVLLSALARRIKVPYPTFLAIGGMLLAFVPGGPSWTLEPDLALALFVAPVLLDAAFDTSLRDLRNNWLPVSTLVFIAVGLTTAPVAVLAHWLLPDMPWAAAIALGAIVAPPGCGGGDRDPAPGQAAVSHPENPRRRKPAQRRQRAVDLSRRRRRRRGPAFQMERVRAVDLLALAGSLVAGYLFARISMPLTRGSPMRQARSSCSSPAPSRCGSSPSISACPAS